MFYWVRKFHFVLLSSTLSRPIAGNVGVYAVRGIGGLKNVAQRNVKPDLIQTVPRY